MALRWWCLAVLHLIPFRHQLGSFAWSSQQNSVCFLVSVRGTDAKDKSETGMAGAVSIYQVR